MRFVLNKDSLEGTYIEKLIIDASSNQHNSSTSYKPRSGKFGVNMHNYTEEQLAYIKSTCEKNLSYFGYAGIEGGLQGEHAVF
mmetsp:Transcript_38493/g.28328  ORF Transcript_38493/g.28328 Transcript_38493/m.28328 type:complete len:83 (+) Transcript_38493:998-1246(+)